MISRLLIANRSVKIVNHEYVIHLLENILQARLKNILHYPVVQLNINSSNFFFDLIANKFFSFNSWLCLVNVHTLVDMTKMVKG